MRVLHAGDVDLDDRGRGRMKGDGMDQYFFGGSWREETAMRNILFAASIRLRILGTVRDADGAKLIKRNWKSVAARPALAEDLVRRSNELARQYDEAWDKR